MKIKLKDIENINRILRKDIGIVIDKDKKSLIELRLSKRIKKLGFKNIKQYLHYLDKNESEKRNLYNSLTTNFTRFFREKYHFDYLRENILLKLKEKSKSDNKKLNFWSAGCSTGEEAYSIAIILSEEFSENYEFNILASDINTEVLKFAKKAIYSEEKIKNIDTKYLHKYFQKGVGRYSGYYKIKNDIKDKVKFKLLNLHNLNIKKLKNRISVIFCRNVLIYFSKPERSRVIYNFKKILKDDGFLILGHSESIDSKNNNWIKVFSNIYQINNRR